ncbi:hypothetical protein SAMN05216301_0735 [Morganella morganii]|nr:hypothetical protein SAMN05216301_0735 [Morganella morganii]
MTEVTKEMCCEDGQTVISIVVNNCCKCGCECKEPEKPEPTCPPVTQKPTCPPVTQTCTPPDTPWATTTPSPETPPTPTFTDGITIGF